MESFTQFEGIFYMPQICDMGPTDLLRLFALKNPTASAGFESANLGTRGQHATTKPPKLLHNCLSLFWYSYMFQWLATIVGLSIQYCNARLKCITNIKSLCDRTSLHKILNVKLYKTKNDCSQAGSRKIMSLLGRRI
jgi:hypothetical protein